MREQDQADREQVASVENERDFLPAVPAYQFRGERMSAMNMKKMNRPRAS